MFIIPLLRGNVNQSNSSGILFLAGVDFSRILCYLYSYKKAVMKTCRPGKILREGATLVQGFRNPARMDTTSELCGGNTATGAPVKAPMSGSDFCCNQGGTVECLTSHP